MKRLGLTLLTAVAVTLVTFPGAAEAEPRQFTVVMNNMSYGKVPTDAKVGDTIIWVNEDSVEHSATARDRSFDLRLLPGKKGRTVLKKAGNIAVYCIMHPMMRTSLRVAAS